MQEWLNWQRNFKRTMMMSLAEDLLKVAQVSHMLRHMIQDILVNKAPVISITSIIQGHGLVVMIHHSIGDRLATNLTIGTPALVILNLPTNINITSYNPTDIINPDPDHVVVTRSISTNINTNI